MIHPITVDNHFQMAAASLTEFWAIATHPASAGRPSTPIQAASFMRALVQAGAQIWLPGPGFGDRLLQLAIDLAVVGPRVFDLQIVATMLVHRVTRICTY